jgi:sodium-dependent dicarboxylate transporter 2/3/5
VSGLLFAVTAALSMWISNTATTAMMIPLVLGIIGQLGGHDRAVLARNSAFLLLGVAYAASVGGIGTIVGSPPNGIAAQRLGLSFQEWLRFGIPCVLVLLPLMFVVLRLTCRPHAGQAIAIAREPFVFNWHRIVTLVIFGFTALAWIFSRQIGRGMGVESSLDTLIALTAVLALLYTRVVRWRDIDRGTDWGVLLLFGGGIALSSVLKDSGASLYLARVFTGAVQGWPMLMVIAAVIGFVIFLTELSSNTATAALLVPIFFTIAGEMDWVPSRLVVPVAVAASCAFMLPVATPPNALVFGTGKVPQRTMMRVGLVMNLVYIVALTLLAQVLF